MAAKAAVAPTTRASGPVTVTDCTVGAAGCVGVALSPAHAAISANPATLPNRQRSRIIAGIIHEVDGAQCGFADAIRWGCVQTTQLQRTAFGSKMNAGRSKGSGTRRRRIG